MFPHHSPQPPPYPLPSGVIELLPSKARLTPHLLVIYVRGHPPVDGRPNGVYDALPDIATILTSLDRCSDHPCVQEAPE